jgi:LysM repeat protein
VVLAALIATGTACSLFAEDDGLEALDGVPIRFATPERITVRSGDTLAAIAVREKVPVDQLIAWNGLMTDRIEVGQVLMIWKPMPPDVDERMVAVKPKPRSTGLGGSLRRLVGAEPEPLEAVAMADDPVPVSVVETRPAGTDGRARIVVSGGAVIGSGVMGVDLGDANVDELARSTAGMARHESDLGEASLGGRGSDLVSGGAADTIEIQRRAAPNLGPQIPDTPVTPPRLSKPAAKRCLSGPSGEMDEHGVMVSQGLSVPQINAGMAGISRSTARCFPRGTVGSYTVIVEVTVGCDGRVSNVFTVSPGVVPAHVTSCIEQTLAYASFPAHAVPDGMGFQYPMKFTF